MPEAPLCVYCRKRPAEAPWVPFCSDRCKMADLGHWLSGDYRVAARDTDGDDDDVANEDLSDSEGPDRQ